MAKKKPTKKQAKAKLPRIPTVPPVLVPALGPLALPYTIGKSAEILADAFIDADPLNRTAPNPSVQRLAQVVNDPAILVDEQMAAIINEPALVMANNGEVMMRATPAIAASPRRSRQFERQNILPRTKRTRKKNGNDKKLSKAFKEANAKLRTKSGKLRKGKTQADVARLAQRLRKKMK